MILKKYLLILLTACCLGLNLAGFAPVSSKSESGQTQPLSGDELKEMKDFDKRFLLFLRNHRIPGAAVTVAYKGKIIFSRGYGFANKETKKPVMPDSLFRVASLSKSLTAVGILSLCQKGKLDLEQKAFVLLSDLKPCDSMHKMDQRIYEITIRELLQCSAGWSHQGANDPIFGNWLTEAANDCTTSLRPSTTAIIRYLLKTRLDYDPGTMHVYSNVSYCILGKVIEKVSGKSYQEYINELLLKPLDLNSIRPGSTVSSAANEVRYYAEEEERDCVLPNIRGPVSAAYGGNFLLEAAPASIGWIASTKDLVRFVSALCGETEQPAPLGKGMMEQMLARPNLSSWDQKQEYFGMGWEVERDKDGSLISFSRHGSLPGTMALVEHQSNGLSWAAAFNSRPFAYESSREEAKRMIKEAVKGLPPSLLNRGSAKRSVKNASSK